MNQPRPSHTLATLSDPDRSGLPKLLSGELSVRALDAMTEGVT